MWLVYGGKAGEEAGGKKMRQGHKAESISGGAGWI